MRNVKNVTAYYDLPVTTSKNNNYSFTTTPHGFKPKLIRFHHPSHIFTFNFDCSIIIKTRFVFFSE